MNPAGVTIALRLWSSDGALLDRGFIRSLTTGCRARRMNDIDIRRVSAYIPSRRTDSRKMTQSDEKEKHKLLNRVRRIRGQLEAVERALQEEAGCAAILQQITACRGALDGLVAEVVEDHIRAHVIDPKASRDNPRARAAEELVEIVHSFLT